MPSKKREPVTVEDFRRAAIEQDQLQKVCEMADLLDDMTSFSYSLNASSLESLNVVIGQPLNVDDNTTCDSATAFFLPWISDEFIRNDTKESKDRWMDKFVDTIIPAQWVIPDMKSR
jgi:hypothetical protein